MAEQGTIEWLKTRLGKWNGSEVGDLMGTPRTKSKLFTDTAMKLINKVRAERHISWLTLDDDLEMEQYLKRSSIGQNAAMKWGSDHEADAADAFVRNMNERGYDIELEHTGSVVHPDIPTFAASPDRVYTWNGVKAIVEIKCPYNPARAFEAMTTVKDMESLKAWNSTYYWQVVAEMACTDANTGDFVVYDPQAEEPIHIVRLDRDRDAELQLINKILEAERYIKEQEEQP